MSGILPEGFGTGFQPFRLTCEHTPLKGEAFLRVIPPGPEVPWIASVTDSVYAGAGRTISSNMVRVSLEEAQQSEELQATVDGHSIRRVGCVCSAADIPRFEIDFRLPAGCSAGKRMLECRARTPLPGGD